MKNRILNLTIKATIMLLGIFPTLIISANHTSPLSAKWIHLHHSGKQKHTAGVKGAGPVKQLVLPSGIGYGRF